FQRSSSRWRRLMSQQQLLYYIMFGYLMSSSFFNFFFELGMCTSWPDLEYIMYRDPLQALF
ncbi:MULTISPECIES: hypothetical protein, partial [unclassified Paenibacillus]|uniref:hypothetical protein n=1 Tax=unclassified Paenibacillus TaxID=185978 RepID=UPI0024730B8A